MKHLVDIKGSDFEGWWYVCACGVEGALYETRIAAEMESEIHMIAESEPA